MWLDARSGIWLKKKLRKERRKSGIFRCRKYSVPKKDKRGLSFLNIDNLISGNCASKKYNKL
jgi:hypothetical protein